MSKLLRDDKSKAAENDQSPADERLSAPEEPATPAESASRPQEIGGRDGPDPTRFGDWEKNGRCIDF